ncbi:MAG: hypothetical protein WAP35_02400, partial [Solirubrobacterales bacterium]
KPKKPRAKKKQPVAVGAESETASADDATDKPSDAAALDAQLDEALKEIDAKAGDGDDAAPDVDKPPSDD